MLFEHQNLLALTAELSSASTRVEAAAVARAIQEVFVEHRSAECGERIVGLRRQFLALGVQRLGWPGVAWGGLGWPGVDLLVMPPARHQLHAEEDAVVLLTVGKSL
ncbi:MAG: hypothetical protein ACYDAQ_16965 [Mycobacteriales bacterium]